VLESRSDSWSLSVRGGGGHDLLTVSPVLELGGGSDGERAACGGSRPQGVAPIGLVNMMNGGGAVLAAELVAAGEGLQQRAVTVLQTRQSCRREPHSVVSCRCTQPAAESGAGLELRLDLRGCGRFLLYASRRPAAVQVGGQPAQGVEWDDSRCALWFTVPWQQTGEEGRLQAVVSFS
jgi:hypothetical protein